MKVLNESEWSKGHHFREVRSDMVLAKVSAVDYCKRDHSVETLCKTWKIQSGSINHKYYFLDAISISTVGCESQVTLHYAFLM